MVHGERQTTATAQVPSGATKVPTLIDIDALDRRLFKHFAGVLKVDPALTRQLVSFQANKNRAVYRWYKYKEAFSASLVEYLFQRCQIAKGRVLDPFAGVGTTLFAASELGIGADGIELLPIGNELISARLLLERSFTSEDFVAVVRWLNVRPWHHNRGRKALPTLRITEGAYPVETTQLMEQYLDAMLRENKRVRAVLRMALLCVLESVSFTRKDGQYLRWDYRSGRRQGERPFNKGEIVSFDKAITAKLTEIVSDTKDNEIQSDFFPHERLRSEVQIFIGSCLDILPQLRHSRYDAIMTSPPYGNRYDYTRTYALELVLLGVGETEIARLRQEMLSCTVENRSKDLLSINSKWAAAVYAADEQPLLQAILAYLENQKAQRLLNNNGIPRMVRGYFYEMACVIAESARILKKNAPLIMVNDNVRYAGACISVDLILSSIAETLGFSIEHILVLPNGKGNSSQQMGEHGRDELRKCVYIWRRQ
jgi:DNA modification methylase